MRVHQPTTSDVTPNGLRIARNAARLRLQADDVAAHRFLCHADGSACEDGCSRAANPARQALYESDIER